MAHSPPHRGTISTKEVVAVTPERHQATAVAHPNIALVKYWGKSDAERNIPAMGSLSITLDGLTTTTTVRLDAELDHDEFLLDGRAAPAMAGRVTACLDRLRNLTGGHEFAFVESANDFPTGAGLASSASGFAALVVAADAAFGAGLDRGALADLARQSSGSAARSLYGGFVELRLTGDEHHPTDTRQILTPAAWPLRVVAAVTETSPKQVGSSEGMRLSAQTSPFYGAWVASSEGHLAAARSAVERCDFAALAEVSETSCLTMHAVMISSRPGLVYWNGATVECLHRVRELRSRGVPVFFTIDAGPQVKAVCLPEAFAEVAAELEAVPGVVTVLSSGLGDGAQVVRT